MKTLRSRPAVFGLKLCGVPAYTPATETVACPVFIRVNLSRPATRIELIEIHIALAAGIHPGPAQI